VEFEDELSPEDFTFTVTGNNPSPEEFAGSANCVDVDIGPGEYVVSEAPSEFGTRIEEGSDCVQDERSQGNVVKYFLYIQYHLLHRSRGRSRLNSEYTVKSPCGFYLLVSFVVDLYRIFHHYILGPDQS